MSGLNFSLQRRPSDNKRPLAGAKIAMPKKPATVNDIFGTTGSDDEQDSVHVKKARQEPASASADQLASRLDPDVVGVAMKLADFVAKNGRQFEDMTRERNPGDTPFKFLHDKTSLGYQFYLAKLLEFEAAKGGSTAPPPPPAPSNNCGPGQASISAPSTSSAHTRQLPHASSQSSQPSSSGLPPEAAAAVAAAAAAATAAAARARAQQPQSLSRGSPAPQLAPLTAEQLAEERRRAQIALAKGDTVAAMEAFATLAAKRDRARSTSVDPEDPDGGAGYGSDDDEARQRRAEPLLNKTAFERRKVVAVYKDDGTRGHHMQDYIPKEVLAEFMAKAGDKMAAVQAEQLANKNAIGADNIGHKLLQKMGWKEGEGLGGSQKGITAPIRAAAAAAPAAGEARGLGASAHGEASADDDMYEAYRKRMMLGYKYRPNPLGNPRRAYY